MKNLKLLFFAKFCCASNDIVFKVLWSKFNFLQVKQATRSYFYFFYFKCYVNQLLSLRQPQYVTTLCGVGTGTRILRQNLYNFTMYSSFKLNKIYVKEINQRYCCPLLPRGDLPIRKQANMVVR